MKLESLVIALRKDQPNSPLAVDQGLGLLRPLLLLILLLEAAHSKRVLDGLPDLARSLDGAIDCCEHAAAGHGGDGQAIATARQAKGDWHQLYVRTQLCQGQADVPQQCSGKDASLADAPPCFVAIQLLKGTAPESWFPATESDISCSSPPYSGGIDPVNRFRWTSRRFRSARDPISAGRCPPSWLSLR